MPIHHWKSLPLQEFYFGVCDDLHILLLPHLRQQLRDSLDILDSAITERDLELTWARKYAEPCSWVMPIGYNALEVNVHVTFKFRRAYPGRYAEVWDVDIYEHN